MIYNYKTKGTCSREIIIETEGDVIKSVKYVGGCAGNVVGVSNLAKDRTIDEVIALTKGIPCGVRGTSCPDQLATALEEIKAAM